jgi:hypothetical protein
MAVVILKSLFRRGPSLINIAMQSRAASLATELPLRQFPASRIMFWSKSGDESDLRRNILVRHHSTQVVALLRLPCTYISTIVSVPWPAQSLVEQKQLYPPVNTIAVVQPLSSFLLPRDARNKCFDINLFDSCAHIAGHGFPAQQRQ